MQHRISLMQLAQLLPSDLSDAELAILDKIYGPANLLEYSMCSSGRLTVLFAQMMHQGVPEEAFDQIQYYGTWSSMQIIRSIKVLIQHID